MEEKKLTDEEIVKALENCNNEFTDMNRHSCDVCPYKDIEPCGKAQMTDILDLIYRLQSDYSNLKERYVKVLGLNEKVIAEQKAEIERLKDERENMQAEILRFEDMKFTQEHCDLYSENETLKQWLKRLNADLEYEKNWGKIQTKQAVKDTAKEIIKCIKLNGLLEYGGYVIHDSTIEQMCKKFGVEVE